MTTEVRGSNLSHLTKTSAAALALNKKLSPSDPNYTPYQPIAEEDIYLPPGRKPHNRDELRPSEDNMDLGPPIVDNDDICRQRFAIKDYLLTLRETIKMHDVTSLQPPQEAVRPAMKSNFFIKEQKWANPAEFIEPDDEACKASAAGKHLEDYID